jgi:hypothetical protein
MITAGISLDEILRKYDKPVNVILMMKFNEKLKGKQSVMLKQRLEQLGFRHVQSGVRLLPPHETEAILESDRSLGDWIQEEIVKKLDTRLRYVLPFVALVDLRKDFSLRRGPPEKRLRTIRDLLTVADLPPELVLRRLDEKHLTIAKLVGLGDIGFLAARCDSSTQEDLELSKPDILRKLRKATGKENPDLVDIAHMDGQKLSAVLIGHVADESAVADAIIDEARFWDRQLRR